MDSFIRYFVKKAYQPKYFPGDRIFGHFHKIPFMATVGNDTVFSETEGPVLVVFLDLPLKYKGKYHTILRVKHRDVKPLVAL